MAEINGVPKITDAVALEILRSYLHYRKLGGNDTYFSGKADSIVETLNRIGVVIPRVNEEASNDQRRNAQ